MKKYELIKNELEAIFDDDIFPATRSDLLAKIYNNSKTVSAVTYRHLLYLHKDDKLKYNSVHEVLQKA